MPSSLVSISIDEPVVLWSTAVRIPDDGGGDEIGGLIIVNRTFAPRNPIDVAPIVMATLSGSASVLFPGVAS